MGGAGLGGIYVSVTVDTVIWHSSFILNRKVTMLGSRRANKQNKHKTKLLKENEKSKVKCRYFYFDTSEEEEVDMWSK